jgi:hypothetical protein
MEAAPAGGCEVWYVRRAGQLHIAVIAIAEDGCAREVVENCPNGSTVLSLANRAYGAKAGDIHTVARDFAVEGVALEQHRRIRNSHLNLFIQIFFEYFNTTRAYFHIRIFFISFFT